MKANYSARQKLTYSRCFYLSNEIFYFIEIYVISSIKLILKTIVITYFDLFKNKSNSSRSVVYRLI